MDAQTIAEALKAFAAMKDGLEGMAAAGTLLSASAKTSVYVIQKGAKLVSYLITASKKKKAARPGTGKDKPGEPKPPARALAGDAQITKPDVAIVVDISRRILVDVAGFLEKQGIDADIVMVTNDPAYGPDVKFLDVNSEAGWLEVVGEFNALMNRIKFSAGKRRIHIFLAAPLPLGFAMGAVWGTVDNATLYHWDGQTYTRVVEITRQLR